ncbi:MAG: hypothetical protein Q9191_006829 [Dirinaria sp. TL-2023a]
MDVKFARSIILDRLPQTTGEGAFCYDAVDYGSCSVQPLDSIATDVRWNQLPERPQRDQEQSEDCLRLTLTCPATVLDTSPTSLPVVVFVHGGALMIGSGDREYYDPIAFCTNALHSSKPIIFASINYRLGALGFLHCPEAAEYLPSNNGLYDQILAFEWIRKFIAGFGGDPENVTAIGQSAGAASLSLHSARIRSQPLYQKAIILAGSTTVLVTMTPEEHQREFLYQAEKLGIKTYERSMADVAVEVIDAPIDAIRRLDYCGAPCSSSELIPENNWATMEHARHARPNAWLKSQILCSSTYDGSISYLVAKGQERTQLAKIFAAICRAKLKDPQCLLNICQISEDDDDDSALEKICQAVTDVGFYGAALNGLLGAAGSFEMKSYFLIFDIGNPFPVLLESGRFATHTWDIVSLLGAYDDMLPEDCRHGISEWRRTVLTYCYTAELPCEVWRRASQTALLVCKDGIKCLDHKMLAKSRAQKLLQFAEQEGGERGLDLLWENVLRFFLKTGNPRYSHEASDIIGKYSLESQTSS